MATATAAVSAKSTCTLYDTSHQVGIDNPQYEVRKPLETAVDDGDELDDYDRAVEFERHEPKVVPSPMASRPILVGSKASASPIILSPHNATRARLDLIRRGEEVGINGKTHREPEHLTNRATWDFARRYLLSHGKLFRAPYPYYHDTDAHTVTRLDGITPEFARTLRQMGLLAGERHTNLVQKNFEQLGNVAEQRTLYRLSYFDGEQVYWNLGDNRMLKVSAEALEEVPLGTDGVILIADDIGSWPSMSELQPYIDALRPLIGSTCTSLLPELPLTKHLTTRWTTQGMLTPEQAQQMLIARFLFVAFASEYPLWPLLLITGVEGSGKSTPFELELTLLRGKKALAQAMPQKKNDLVASATNRSFLVYDNIDGANLADPKRDHISDFLCQLASGAEEDLRQLFVDNHLGTYKVQNHTAFTSRVNPFPRSDTQRRVIHLETEPRDCASTVSKDELFKAVLANRTSMLAEFALRLQNILRAHIANRNRKQDFVYQSAMVEYEKYSLICASYENTLDATQTMWKAFVTQFQESISVDNAMVFAVRLWLGEDQNNVGRHVTGSVLFTEVQAAYKQIDQKFPYTAAHVFSKAVLKNQGPLGILGLQYKAREYWFSPTDAELKQCRRLHIDMFAAANGMTSDGDGHLIDNPAEL